MTQAEKRKKWESLVSEQAASSKNIAEWCREQHVSYSLFLYWKKRLCEIHAESADTPMITLDFGNGLRVEAKPGFDEQTLRRLVLMLQECWRPAARTLTTTDALETPEALVLPSLIHHKDNLGKRMVGRTAVHSKR